MKNDTVNQTVELADEANPEYLFSTTWNCLLVQIVRGKIDPVALAKQTLESRGVTEKSYDEWEKFTSWR